jgi:hypothetical protein
VAGRANKLRELCAPIKANFSVVDSYLMVRINGFAEWLTHSGLHLH